MTTFRPMAARTKYRMPEHGRIRLGIQVPTRTPGKTRPEKLMTLRFTSADRGAIDALAAIYGGSPRPWQNGNRAEHEVITEAPEARVILPPDPLGDTPYYELWSKGGLQRRCDGDTMSCPTRVGKDDVDIIEHPCQCNAQKRAECKVTIRLAVILPDIPFGGTWRVDSHSWNARDELPSMVEAIQSFSQRARFVPAFLGIRQEEKMNAGQKQEFIVPYLRIGVSVEQVLAGAGQLDAIAAPGAAGEIGPAPDDAGESGISPGRPAPDLGPVPPVPPPPPVAREDGILYITVTDGKNQLKSAILTIVGNDGQAKTMARELWAAAELPDDPSTMVDEETIAGLIEKATATLAILTVIDKPTLDPSRPF